MLRVEPRDDDWLVGLWVDEERVTRTRVPALEVRIEEAVLTAGGIAGLRTQEAHQGRGYATQVMDRALALMAGEGMALSLLVGIPNFYHRWHYRTVIPLYRLTVQTRDLEVHLNRAGVPAAPPARPFTQDDVEPVRAWHEQENRTRTGTLVRRPGVWTGFEQSSGFDKDPVLRMLLAGEDGPPAGYVVFDAEVTEELVVAELGCAHWPRDLPALLRLLVNEAAARGSDSIRLQIPMDHPAAHYLREVSGELTVTYYDNRHLMGRIVDLKAVREAMAPVWARRLAGSLWRGERRRLQVGTDLGELVLDWDGLTLETGIWIDGADRSGRGRDPEGTITVRCGQDLLCAALFGHVPGSALPLLGGEAEEGTLELLDCLFPHQLPFLWSTDWF